MWFLQWLFDHRWRRRLLFSLACGISIGVGFGVAIADAMHLSRATLAWLIGGFSFAGIAYFYAVLFRNPVKNST
ncbi:MAG: hypothetical protein V1838_03035 [Patescibacteria group bacterium]